MKTTMQAPEYFMYNDQPVHWVLDKDGMGWYETKEGKPIPMVRVFEDGNPITKEEYDNA